MFWVEGKVRRKCVLANLPKKKKKVAFYFLRKAIMYFCHSLPTLKQLNLLCSNFPEQFALRLLPELQDLHPKDESRRVPQPQLQSAEQRHLQTGRGCASVTRRWAPPAPLTAPSSVLQTGDAETSVCPDSGHELLRGRRGH